MDASDIKNIRMEHKSVNMFEANRWVFWGIGPGKVVFDYGFKTFSFGLGVDDAEANYIVCLLNEHF
jgi:hypothetical protein